MRDDWGGQVKQGGFWDYSGDKQAEAIKTRDKMLFDMLKWSKRCGNRLAVYNFAHLGRICSRRFAVGIIISLVLLMFPA